MKKYDDLEKTNLTDRAAEPKSSYGPSVVNPQNVNGMISLIRNSRNGVAFERVNALADRLSFSLSDLSKILHISSRSLHRYDDNKILDIDTSAVVLTLENLYNEGLETFDDDADFSEWLRSSLPYLGGDTPLSYLDTPFGFDLVKQILGRIRHGVFA